MNNDSMTDLGYIPEKSSGPCCVDKPDDKPKEPVYPTICARDDSAKKLKEALAAVMGGALTLDQDFVATFKIRVCGMADKEYDKSLDLKVIAIGTVEEDESADEQPDPEDQAEDASGKHANPAVNRLKNAKKKPAVKTDATTY